MPDHVYDDEGFFDDAEDEPLFRGRNPSMVESEGYLFGMELANEERYRNREWEEIEDELRRIWRQRYNEEPFDAHLQDIIKGWGDGLLGPDPEGMRDRPGMNDPADFYLGKETPEALTDMRNPDAILEDRDRLDDVTGSALMGDLGDTVRIVSSDEMAGKIDGYYVDQMDDLSDAPDIDTPGNRGDDSAHLDLD